MAKTLTFHIDANEAKQLEAGVAELLNEVAAANQRMEQRQIEIDNLKAETRAMLNQLKQMRGLKAA